jgi:hypothetical protein
MVVMWEKSWIWEDYQAFELLQDVWLIDFTSGKKCKFSHNLDIERKVEKRSLYTDTREEEKEEKEKDNMADWDEEKLRQVVMSKHGNPKTTTDKVCKFFVSAVEDGKYGWFWTCPNGGDKCMYKHSLPPGYVLSLFILFSPRK